MIAVQIRADLVMAARFCDRFDLSGSLDLFAKKGRLVSELANQNLFRFSKVIPN